MDTINLDDLTPTRPYMVKAMFEWLEDNHLTPYIMVDTTLPHVVVPTEFIQDNRIVLSIASRSTHQFHMDNEFINFQGRFGGVSKEIWVPFYAVMGIYAKESNHLGMFFDPNEYDEQDLEKTAKTNSNHSSKDDGQKEKPSRPRRENTAGLKVLK